MGCRGAFWWRDNFGGRMGGEIENMKRELAELKAEVRRLGEEVHRLKIGVQPPRDSEAARHQKARRQIETNH